MSPRSEAICLLGHHEPGYPRHRSVREALEAAGLNVLEVHSRAPFPWRHVILAAGYLRVFRKVKWVFITEGGHRLVPFMKLLTLLTGRQLAFDPFLSRYNTRIEDRRLHSPRGWEAWLCLWQDWSSTHAADLLVFDTQEHREYFFAKYGLAKPNLIFPVGVDESVFHPDPKAAAAEAAGAETAAAEAASGRALYPQAGFQVLFYGTYIPLQGIEWIVRAAALLAESDVRFTLIGAGQTAGEIQALAATLRAANIRFLATVKAEELAAYLAGADLALGIFGGTVKADNVVANKIVQAAAMGKAIVTRDSKAVGRYFRDGESIALVPAADPGALARKIMEIRRDAELHARLGAGARAVFERSFSVTSLSRLMQDTFSDAARIPPTRPLATPG